MSEEEKKAIEYLKRHIMPVYGRKGNIEYMINDVLLNLIEKQQKELEQEKEKNRHITKETIEFVNSHYIHKDTIREILDKKIGDNCYKLGNYGCYVRDSGTSEQERTAGEINALKKLKKQLLEKK